MHRTCACYTTQSGHGKSVNKGAVLFSVQHSQQVVEAKRGQILSAVPSFVFAYRCPTVKSLRPHASQTPVLLTELTLPAALEISQRQARRRRGFNRLLELARLSLCPSPLFESSAHTAAQINHNCSTCSVQKCQHRLKRPLCLCVSVCGCLFVCLSVCLFCLPFFPRNGGGGGEKGERRMDD